MEPAYPAFMSAPLQDLLQHLLEKDPAKRLRGALHVAAHAFFEGLDWSVMRSDPDPDVLEGPEKPPFAPGNSLNVEDPDEIGHFPDLPDVVVDPAAFPEGQWRYVSEQKFQEEVVWLLQFEEHEALQKKPSRPSAPSPEDAPSPCVSSNGPPSTSVAIR